MKASIGAQDSPLQELQACNACGIVLAASFACDDTTVVLMSYNVGILNQEVKAKGERRITSILLHGHTWVYLFCSTRHGLHQGSLEVWQKSLDHQASTKFNLAYFRLL